MSGEHILLLHSQLFMHALTQAMITHFLTALTLQTLVCLLLLIIFFVLLFPPAVPLGLFLQVDGKERGADCVCRGQRHLIQADVTATGLSPSLQ